MRLRWLLLLSLGTPLIAQTTDGPTTLHVTTQLVLLDASVENRKTGVRVGDLTLEDFTLAEDKQTQKLTYLSEDRLPLSLTLLFDVTESVLPVLKPLAAGATGVLAHLKPEDEVAVLTFSSHTELLQPFTTDRELAAAAIVKAAKSGERKTATFIYEDMYEAIEETAKATIPNSRRVQLWLTDGTANYENAFMKKHLGGKHAPAMLHSKAESTEALTRSGQVVTELEQRSLVTDTQLPMIFLIGRLGDIHHFADLTGGPVVHTSKAEVAERMGALIDAIRQRYTLGYKPSVAKPPGTLCHVDLRLSKGFFERHPELNEKDLVVRTRRSYYR